MRLAATNRGLWLGVSLALALGAPASAQTAPPVRIMPGGGGGVGLSPLVPLLPILGGVLLHAGASNAQTPPPVDGQPGTPPPRQARALTPRKAPPPKFVARAFPPPPGETRFAPGEVLVETANATNPATIQLILRRHRLEEAEVDRIDLIGASLRRWRFTDRRGVGAVVAELGGEGALTRIQPNYVYALQDDAAAPPPGQYQLARMHVEPALDAPGSEPVRVAVIDTAIDDTHPDLVGVVEARYDALGGTAHNLDHGTAMAGAIAAHGAVKGVAPSARILSARAFDADAGGAHGSSLSIFKALDWTVKVRASIVNMSFAGPQDPTLHEMLGLAYAKGLTLVSAMGNAGPKSPPLYPGADEKVIAITATDAEDRLYEMANVGPYVALAAPGVDVLLPAPKGGYALETGTSVSAALVSGVAALLVERKPKASPAEIRKWLTASADPLQPADPKHPFGAGLADAARATAMVSASAGK